MPGKHRAPSQTPQNIRAAARTSVITAAGGAMLVSAAGPSFAGGEDWQWDIIADCESGNRNIESYGPSSASGYFQIIDGTWAGAGGREFAPRAISATYDQQRTVAERIHDRAGSFRDWNASRSCWAPRFAAGDVEPAPTPPVEPEPAPEPPPTPVEPPTEPEVLEDGQEYVVKPGDWLSKIALTNGICSPDDDIRTCWEPLYEENRDVIGDNPDLIVPGMTLSFVGGLVLAEPPVPVQEDDEVETEIQAQVEQGELSLSGFAHPAPAGPLTSGFRGARPDHNGADFDGKIGDPIHAATDGLVTRAESGTSGGYGTVIYIEAADGTETRYAHLSALFVSKGDYVAAGQTIGAMGNTGATSRGPAGDGSHLHFEVHIGPGAINPIPWLADRGLLG